MSKENLNEFKTRLGLLLRELGIRKSQFAKSIWVSPAYISSILNSADDKEMSNSLKELICLKYHVSWGWLDRGTGEMFTPEGQAKMASFNGISGVRRVAEQSESYGVGSDNRLMERIQLLLFEAGLEPEEFCQQIELPEEMFSAFNRPLALPKDIFDRVLEAFPFVRKTWLKLGQGNPWVKSHQSRQHADGLTMEILALLGQFNHNEKAALLQTMQERLMLKHL